MKTTRAHLWTFLISTTGLILLVTSFQNCGFRNLDLADSDLTKSEDTFMSLARDTINLAEISTGTSDDREVLLKAFEMAKLATTPTLIKLEAKTYRLSCPSGYQLYCFDLTNVRGLRLQGVPGQTKLLVTTPRSGLFNFKQSSNIEFLDFSVDYETPPFTQGRVLSVAADNFVLRIDAGYPSPASELLNQDIFGRGQHALLFPIDGSDPVLKHTSLDNFSVGTLPTPLSSTDWRFVPSTDLRSKLAPGDRVAYGPRSSYGFFFTESSNITLLGVTIYTAPSLALAFVNNDGAILIDRLQIILNPQTNRVLSAVADAIHMQNNRASVIVQNSRFQGMGDDAMNTYSTGSKVVAVISATMLTIARPDGPVTRIGDVIQFTNAARTVASRGPGGEVTVASVVDQGANLVLSFNQDISRVGVGDVAFNVNAATPNFRMSGNLFNSFRGQLRIRSAGAVVSSNSFDDPRNAQILFSIDSYWNEGPMAGPPSMAANTVHDGSAIRLLGLNFTPYLGPVREVAVEAPVVTAPVVTAPVSVPGFINLYRLFNAQYGHLISQLVSESGFVSDGAIFSVAPTATSVFSLALYRCHMPSSGHMFNSTNAACEGQTPIAVLGFIAPTASATATVPIYRCHSGVKGHLLTNNPTECVQNAYAVEGLMGYAH